MTETLKKSEELAELKELLIKNNVDISDMDDVISVAHCSVCCAVKNGG